MDLPNDTFRYQDEVFDYADHSTSSGNNVTATSDNNTTAEQIREIEEMNNAAVIEAGNNKLASERQHTNGSANVYEDNNTNIAAAVEPMNVEEGGTKSSCLFNFKNEGFKMMKIGVPQNVTDEFWSEDNLQ